MHLSGIVTMNVLKGTKRKAAANKAREKKNKIGVQWPEECFSDGTANDNFRRSNGGGGVSR